MPDSLCLPYVRVPDECENILRNQFLLLKKTNKFFFPADSESAAEDGLTTAVDPTSPDSSQPEAADAVDGTSYSYQPVVWHWFFLKEIDKSKKIWKPFSMLDSVALEDIFHLR